MIEGLRIVVEGLDLIRHAEMMAKNRKEEGYGVWKVYDMIAKGIDPGESYLLSIDELNWMEWQNHEHRS